MLFIWSDSVFGLPPAPHSASPSHRPSYRFDVPRHVTIDNATTEGWPHRTQLTSSPHCCPELSSAAALTEVYMLMS